MFLTVNRFLTAIFIFPVFHLLVNLLIHSFFYVELPICFFRIVSSVQAILSCLAGSIVCLYSCSRSFMTTSHYASEAYAWFGTSYFLYDIWSMYKVHASQLVNQKQVGDFQTKSVGEIAMFKHYIKTQPIIIAHHLFIGSFGFLVIVVSIKKDP